MAYGVAVKAWSGHKGVKGLAPLVCTSTPGTGHTGGGPGVVNSTAYTWLATLRAFLKIHPFVSGENIAFGSRG